MSAIDRLLERLRTGWSPSSDHIAREAPQRDLIDWDFWKSGETLIGYPFNDVGWCEVRVLWIDRYLTWAPPEIDANDPERK